MFLFVVGFMLVLWMGGYLSYVFYVILFGSVVLWLCLIVWFIRVCVLLGYLLLGWVIK